MSTLSYVGWALSILGVLPIIASGILYIVKFPVVVKNMEHVGFSSDVVPGFGVVKVIIGALYLIPATSFVGAILATGWMGGAISAHIRVKDSYFVQTIIPILIWVGFAFRHHDAMHALGF